MKIMLDLHVRFVHVSLHIFSTHELIYSFNAISAFNVDIPLLIKTRPKHQSIFPYYKLCQSMEKATGRASQSYCLVFVNHGQGSYWLLLHIRMFYRTYTIALATINTNQRIKYWILETIIIWLHGDATLWANIEASRAPRAFRITRRHCGHHKIIPFHDLALI